MLNPQPIPPSLRPQVTAFIEKHCITTDILIRGEIIDMTVIEGFVIIDDDEIIGLLTYEIKNDICEIVSLNSIRPNQGIGTLLIKNMLDYAREKHCRRIQLLTTNDNINAIQFYQRQGFDMLGVNPGAINRERQLKPEIPLLGHFNIPLAHEILFAITLTEPEDNGFEIKRITDPDEKSQITKNIMGDLPTWFSPPEYIEKSAALHRTFPLFAAIEKKNNTPVGFVALKEHNAFTSEVNVIGILSAYHKNGLGRRLMEAAAAYLKQRGFLYLTVKTLDESAYYEPYEHTRNFYRGVGFVPLEVFPVHWDADNPCLFLVMAL